MFNSQPPARQQQSTTAAQSPANLSAWQFDDDLAIGCECANPALQIERWAQEEAAQPTRDFS
jgi:hypothetical protein